MANRVSFTKSSLEAIAAPRSGRLSIRDDKVRGLFLRVTPTGAKSFCFYRKIDGRPKRVTLGEFPEVTIEQARKKAEALNANPREAAEIAEKRRQERQTATFGVLATYYLDHADSRLRTAKHARWQYDKYLAHLAHRRAKDITVAEVKALLGKLATDSGNATANRVHDQLRAIFSLARKDLGWRHENPAAGIAKFPTERKEKYVTKSDMPRVMAAIDAETNPAVRDLFLFAFFTGARRGNLQAAHRDEFDLGAKVWTIPASKAKAGRPIHVPLTGESLAVAKRRIESAGPEGWLFPGRHGRGHIVEVKAAWKRICDATGLKGIRFHDIRHSVASWLVTDGVPLFTVGEILGNPRAVARYAHLQTETKLSALAGVTAAMAKKPRKGKERT